MSKHANPTLIGIFVAGAIGLIVAGILIISGGKLLLADHTNFVLYFKGSVKGLNVGSPVSFRGVNIGTVTEIQLVVNEEDAEIHIPVIIEIDNTKFTSGITGKSIMVSDDGIDRQIKSGLRAQLQLQSLLTGQLFIQIDYFPDSPLVLVNEEMHRWSYREIPTIPTPIEIIGELLKDFPMEQAKEHFLASLAGIDKLVNSEELQQTIVAMREALESIRQLADNMDQQVRPVSANLNQTLDDTRSALRKADATLDDISRAMAQADTTLKSADAVLNDRQILSALDNALGEISAAAYAIRILAESINNNPESLIRGRR